MKINELLTNLYSIFKGKYYLPCHSNCSIFSIFCCFFFLFQFSYRAITEASFHSRRHDSDKHPVMFNGLSTERRPTFCRPSPVMGLYRNEIIFSGRLNNTQPVILIVLKLDFGAMPYIYMFHRGTFANSNRNILSQEIFI